MPSTKRCVHCGSLYVPDRRTAAFQKSCRRSVCRRARQRQAYQSWWGRNRDYDSARRGDIRRWAKDYPDCWKRYRQTRPVYRDRGRKRRSASSASRHPIRNMDPGATKRMT